MFKHLLTTTALVLALSTNSFADALKSFDVAEDHKRIFMAATPLHENGMPAHGNAFISQGYIYPAGTLEAETIGVLEDGSPAFPDKVLGTWTCDGYFVGEGGNATSGVWIISRQVFAFDDGETIVTQGAEIVDTGVENLRPITGATGDYAGLSGAMAQTLLGFSENMTVNVSFRLTTDASDHANYTPINEGDHLEWDSGAPIGPISDQHTGPLG